ncbi:MAG: asparaginase [Myxococcales bacterium]|nr:asparaginase [Myxococcota bacterium]MDW8282047.1 asparaginase [Myxococcales bacterium]
MNIVSMKITVTARRGGYDESVHRVRAAVVDARDVLLAATDDPQGPVFWRSTAKAFQALSMVRAGALERFGLGAEHLAVACGSHSGAEEHVQVVGDLLQRIGATVEDLHCAPHTPIGEQEARALRIAGQAPTRLHNNCSGKHAAMLATCRARGWPLAGYHRLPHPLQVEILDHMARVTDIPADAIETAVDGCGAVVFRTPLVALARAFRRLAADQLPEPLQEAGRRVRQAVQAAPRMVAGANRLCTALVETTSGRLLGKVGGEGVYGLGVHGGGSAAAAFALKVEDGGGRAVGPAVCALARHLGWLSDEELERLRPFWEVPLWNHQKEHIGDLVVEVKDATGLTRLPG